jgi:hypothetical protein
MKGYQMKAADVYLGDGVYASYDGYVIWLDLRGQDSTTKIGLEPEVLNNLVEYGRKVFKQQEER